MASAAEINDIIKFYVGYYNRAPDALGLNFWISAFDGGFSLADMAVDFSGQVETLANYPFFDPTLRPAGTDPTVAELGQFIDSVYQNLFNRSPDQPGKDFWSTKISLKEFSVGEAISLIIAGATTAPDSSVVSNKVAAGLNFYNKLNAEPGGPEYVFKASDVTAATAIQAGVTNDIASLASAAAATDSYIAGFFGTGEPIPDPDPEPELGITINLTELVDLPGDTGLGADTQGTSGDDVYTATVGSSGQSTLQSSDVIAAGDGIDTLNIRMVSSGFFEIVAPSATGLENVVVTNQGQSNLFGLDFSAISGVTEVTAKDTVDSSLTSFEKLESGTKIRIDNVDGDTMASFKGDRSASANDAFDLFVQDSGTTTRSASLFISQANGPAPDRSFEIANVETGGTTASFLNLGGLALDALVISGTQQLNVEDTASNFADLETVDASAMTGGGLNLNAEDNATSSFAFVGSGFDDALELNDDLFSNANTLSLDGGDGTDTLVIGTFSSERATSINRADGFEILEAKDRSDILRAGDYTKIDTFSFAGQSGNEDQINISGVTTDDRFIFSSDVGRNDEAVRFAADTAGQSLTFELRAESGTDGEIRIVSDIDIGNDTAAIGFGNNNINSVEIISSGSNAAANVIRAVDNTFDNFSFGNDQHFAFANENGPNSFQISGSQALTITAEEGVSLDALSDERGFESGVSVNGSEATGDLRIAGSVFADAIAGGSGDDVLYGLGGNDVLTGNAGADQFRFSDFRGADEIKDFRAGQDKIGLQRLNFENTNESSAGTALSTSDYVQNLQAVANMSNADDNKLVELQNAATQSQITQTSTSATTAYLLVFNETSGKGELWFDNDWGSITNRELRVEFDNITELADLVGLTNTDFVEYIF